MQYIQPHIEQKLGIESIRELIKKECIGEIGRDFSDKIRFLTSYKKIEYSLNQTEEFRQVLLSENTPPPLEYVNTLPELDRIKIEGVRIEKDALAELRVSIKTAFDFQFFFLKKTDSVYPLLSGLSENVNIHVSILPYINRLIDEKGEILDHASETLFEIRREYKQKEVTIDKQMIKIFNQAKKSGWTPENSGITIRNGRMVIPLIDTHRRKLKGYIHDESATRQTAFLEPSEIVELNNDLRELQFAERREIDKILLTFTDFLRPFVSDLIFAYRFLGLLDFIRAKAKFAIKIQAVLPQLYDKPLIHWVDARHPILYLSLAKQQKEIVSLQVELQQEKRILIISGPNAGGKSVCLKTIGLLQYMLQCGLLVPVKESSSFGIFHSVFIEIGDEQSIENDLSTYSSHLQNMKKLLENADSRTLFLIDEFGSGTEPKIGGAIAEAILHQLSKKESFGVVTTHYSNLKLMADHHPEMQNGAMLFDTEMMRPLYKLVVGKPGSSFAFEIAKKIGLPEEVLNEVATQSGQEILNFEKQLHQIEVDKINIEKKKTELQVADEFLSEMIEKYTQLNEQLEAKRHEMISQARLEAKQLVKEANRQIENTISEIKKSQAEKTTTQELRKNLALFSEQIEIESKKQQKPEKKRGSPQIKNVNNFEKDTSELTVGDIVSIDNMNTFGEVFSIKGNKVEVVSNSIKLTIARDKLIKTKKKSIPLPPKQRGYLQYGSVLDSINELRATFSITLDVRGRRGEEAMDMVRKFIDDAQLLGEKEVRILHGKGDGILKSLIRDYLSKNAEIKMFQPEHIEHGGEGITIVILK